MKISTDGIVIWEVKTGEADRVITILTENGVVSAYARGSLRPKNKLTSPTAMLSFSNFELYSGKNMYNVDDAVGKERFVALFSDVEKLSLASYFCELLKYLAPIDDDAREYLSLMLNSLYLLNKGNKKLLLIKAVFELRIMALSGYMPDLVCCASCGAADAKSLHFDILNGIWYCENCSINLGKYPNMSDLLLHTMRHIIYSDKGKIFSFDIPMDALRKFNELTSQFISIHVDRQMPTLDFLLSILEE